MSAPADLPASGTQSQQPAPVPAASPHDPGGLVLNPFRALRPRANGPELARLLCPPYDVIDAAARADLLAANPHNAVALILPEPGPKGEDAYAYAAQSLEEGVRTGRWAVDERPALYVYDMTDEAGATTRGLVGALALRDPADGIVLPHENTMAGPVADRLALMSATETDLEPIYLVYDGGGATSALVAGVDADPPIARTTTADGITHTIWAVTDVDAHAAIARDLAPRSALIADGHHRYATYRALAERLDTQRGAGPWDAGLTLLVDSTSYGPQVHAIHRVITTLSLDTAVHALETSGFTTDEVGDAASGLARATDRLAFAAVLSDGTRFVLVVDADRRARDASRRADEPDALADLDVTVLHRGLVEQLWQLTDTEDVVGYAHGVDEALHAARTTGGVAVLLRPTPVEAVAAVAAAGARMPRKSTLFTPKPASGLLMRRFADDG